MILIWHYKHADIYKINHNTWFHLVSDIIFITLFYGSINEAEVRGQRKKRRSHAIWWLTRLEERLCCIIESSTNTHKSTIQHQSDNIWYSNLDVDASIMSKDLWIILLIIILLIRQFTEIFKKFDSTFGFDNEVSG